MSGKPRAASVRPWVILAVITAVALLVSACGQSGGKSALSYQGKSVTFIVPASAGGNTDVRARLVAQFFGKSVPGNPTILVENRDGGGGAIAWNQFEQNAKPDGQTFVLGTPGTPIRWMTKEKGHDYDMSKMRLAAAFGVTGAMYVRGDSGIKTAKDLYKSTKVLGTGHTNIGSSLAQIEKVVELLLDVKFKFIPGYGSYGDTMLATLRNEVQAGWIDANLFPKLDEHVKSGALVPLFQIGLYKGTTVIKDPRARDLPLLADVFKEATGKDITSHALYQNFRALLATQSFGTSFWLPNGTPDDVYNGMVDSFRKMAESKEYQEAALKLMGAEDLVVVGKDAQDILQLYLGLPKEAHQVLK